MKVIYVAGPYRADTTYGVFQNIRAAEKVSVRLWNEGWAVLCPHLNSALMSEGHEPIEKALMEDSFLKGGLEMVQRCDSIYMMEGWRSSEGAKAELKVAKKNNLEIIYEEDNE